MFAVNRLSSGGRTATENRNLGAMKNSDFLPKDDDPNVTNHASEKAWRYMSFARFIWLLQTKQLWLSRADLLGDPWEITLAGDQLAHVISRHPPHDIFSDKVHESAVERSERIIKLWRRSTFVNCWSASSHESHALWRIYCPSAEGVAIQTTFTKLRDSVEPCSLFRVTYEVPGKNKRTPTRSDLVSRKRPMFAYEHEVRVVRHDDAEPPPEILGYRLDWNPERNVESIRVHPEADDSFMETVATEVERHAPALKKCVAWSDMNARPPF